MSALAFTVALLASSYATADAKRPDLLVIEDAIVVSQSSRPVFGSGILAVWAEIDVEAPGVDRDRMYLLYGGPDQFIPPVNSMCRIVFERARIRGISNDGSLDGRTQRNRVEQLDCDTGSWLTF